MEKQRKTIQINPDFFKIGKRTRKQKQAKKRSDLRQTIKPNNLKKQLLVDIRKKMYMMLYLKVLKQIK